MHRRGARLVAETYDERRQRVNDLLTEKDSQPALKSAIIVENNVTCAICHDLNGADIFNYAARTASIQSLLASADFSPSGGVNRGHTINFLPLRSEDIAEWEVQYKKFSALATGPDAIALAKQIDQIEKDRIDAETQKARSFGESFGQSCLKKASRGILESKRQECDKCCRAQCQTVPFIVKQKTNNLYECQVLGCQKGCS